MNNNITKSVIGTKDCYGCGLCVKVCRKHVLDIQLNTTGFFEPIAVNIEDCVDCGLCQKVCSYNGEVDVFHPNLSYAGWSKNPENRKLSSSGGVAYEIAKTALEHGFSIICVKYNIEKKRAEHYIAENIDELNSSRGSKYIQSYTVDALKQIDRHKKYVFIGSPCQAASVRLFVDTFKLADNFIIIDFFCHGIPSYNLWNKYLEKHSIDLGTIKEISWRNKKKGWHNGYCMTIQGENATYQSYKQQDDFYAFFLGDACLGEACYDSCKFKYDKSCADIRLGDLWGKKFAKNQDGVSSVIVFTQKGNTILSWANVNLDELPFEDAAEGQMKSTARRPWYYNICSKKLNQDSYDLSFLGILLRYQKVAKSYISKVISVIKK